MNVAYRLAAGALAAAAALPAAAQDAAAYPQKAIRIIVPRPPSGFNDTLARLLAAKLQARWQQPVVVDNRPGAATLIGTEAAAKAPADGYTLLVVAFQFVVNASLYKNLPYDTLKDFAPVVLAGETANLLVVSAKSPIKSVAQLIEEAKKHPGKLNYASAGNGSSNHMSMELLKNLAGVDLVQIPYKGSGPMVTDLLGGQVDVMFDNAPNVLPHIRNGKMRALASTGTRRSKLVPDVPTMAEAGLPGYEVSVFYGLVAPAGTPAPIVDKLNATINEILAQPDVGQTFTAQGVEPIGGSAQDFARHLDTQVAKWAKVVAQAGIKPD
ncbi:tripartite tricarboxylate transporter substrate binding protein [Pigmentiphaga soli]|uniref:Tripartite tricarboxylate transporter substrate binding protein n=1 Tax=Pigmentiphaga soli TaxID=1007095 RepID=A0ABP8HSN0_9BURK